MNEKGWVHSLAPRLKRSLAKANLPRAHLDVSDGKKLPYTCEIHGYSCDGKSEPNSSSYETDLLICDTLPDGRWIPRVVVECKLGGVTTHDALTYSTKAATHKHVHPYLRYGFLAGKLAAIPARLVKHGAHFDFVATWRATKPTNAEWKNFCAMLVKEIEASRELQRLLTINRSASRRKYHILHRPLLLK